MEKIIHKLFDFYKNRKSEFFFVIGAIMIVSGTFCAVVFPFILQLGQ